jgi:hypothetical protein
MQSLPVVALSVAVVLLAWTNTHIQGRQENRFGLYFIPKILIILKKIISENFLLFDILLFNYFDNPKEYISEYIFLSTKLEKYFED